MGRCYVIQDFTRRGAGAGKITGAEWAVGDHRNAVAFAPRDDSVFDGPFVRIVQNLIAGDCAGAGDSQGFVEIVDIEITDAPAEDFAGCAQILKGGEGFGQGEAATPVQEVRVEVVGPELLQGAFAGL